MESVAIPLHEIEEPNKRKKKEKKEVIRKRETRTIAFRRTESAPATVLGHRLFVYYIRSSISIYNIPSPYAAPSLLLLATMAGRKSHQAENGFSWEMWRARNATHSRSDDIAKLKRSVLSRVGSAKYTIEEIIVSLDSCDFVRSFPHILDIYRNIIAIIYIFYDLKR